MGRPMLVVAFVLQAVLLGCVGGARPEGSADDGARAFREFGCDGCHVDGAGQIAPALEGLYRAEVVLDDGSTVVADEAYLRESIKSPGARMVRGFRPVMPEYGSRLGEAELEALVNYILSLSL